MTDINLKTLTPDTSLPTTGFLFGADSQASTNPSVYSTQTVATTLLGSTSLTGDVLTASAPVLDLAQTWNSSGVTFTGMKFNAAGTSDANSASASLLMDLQVNTASKLKVKKDGTILFNGSVNGIGLNNNVVQLGNPANAAMGVTGTSSAQMSVNAQFGFAQGNPASYDAPDTILSRKAAANLRFGAADAASPVAQTLSVQSIVAGQTNASAAAYPFTITGAQGTGTGAGGSIVFQVAPAGGSGTAQNALVKSVTVEPAGTAGALAVYGSGSTGAIMYLDATNLSNGARYQFYSATIGAQPFFGVYNVTQNVTPLVVLSRSSASAPSMQLVSGASIGWSPDAQFNNTIADTTLYRDNSNILALKNSTNAQEFRVYETTTGPIYKALLGNRQLMKISGASFTDGAGSSAGTLTNAPAVGNPTKWIPIDDNGTTRYIPAW